MRKILPFNVADLKALGQETLDNGLLDRYKDSIGYSVFDDDGIVVSYGLYTCWEGVGEVWLIPGERFLRHVKECVRLIRGAIDVAILQFGFHRLQATCEDDQRCMKFLESVGFEWLAKMEQYQPDKSDGHLYEMVIRG